MPKPWYFINNSTHDIFVVKSNCRAAGKRDGAGIETLRLLFYICCSSKQEKSNKITYFAENLKRQVFPMHAM